MALLCKKINEGIYQYCIIYQHLIHILDEEFIKIGCLVNNKYAKIITEFMEKSIKFIENCKENVIKCNDLKFADAVKLIRTPGSAIPYLLAAANQIKLKFVGKKVILCGIVNAKSGKCSEDCSFCAQSAHHKTNAKIYSLLPVKDLTIAAKDARKSGSNCFSIVTSGRGVVAGKDFETLKRALKSIKKSVKIKRCASLGLLTLSQAVQLKQAGLNTYHHNLEAAESFFAKICTTHSFKERIQTIDNAIQAGLKVCSGGIIGLGETEKQRIELAYTLKKLKVDSIPINILNPVKGTKVEKNYQSLTPLEILKTIAVYRFILPQKTIGVFGGRETNLRDLQSMIFWAGANSMLIGNYLTTHGRDAEMDYKLVRDLELAPE